MQVLDGPVTPRAGYRLVATTSDELIWFNQMTGDKVIEPMGALWQTAYQAVGLDFDRTVVGDTQPLHNEYGWVPTFQDAGIEGDTQHILSLMESVRAWNGSVTGAAIDMVRRIKNGRSCDGSPLPPNVIQQLQPLLDSDSLSAWAEPDRVYSEDPVAFAGQLIADHKECRVTEALHDNPHVVRTHAPLAAGVGQFMTLLEGRNVLRFVYSAGREESMRAILEAHARASEKGDTVYSAVRDHIFGEETSGGTKKPDIQGLHSAFRAMALQGIPQQGKVHIPNILYIGDDERYDVAHGGRLHPVLLVGGDGVSMRGIPYTAHVSDFEVLCGSITTNPAEIRNPIIRRLALTVQSQQSHAWSV